MSTTVVLGVGVSTEQFRRAMAAPPVQAELADRRVRSRVVPVDAFLPDHGKHVHAFHRITAGTLPQLMVAESFLRGLCERDEACEVIALIMSQGVWRACHEHALALAATRLTPLRFVLSERGDMTPIKFPRVG